MYPPGGSTRSGVQIPEQGCDRPDRTADDGWPRGGSESAGGAGYYASWVLGTEDRCPSRRSSTTAGTGSGSENSPSSA